MSVQLGVLNDEPGVDNGNIQVMAADYSGDWISLEQGDDQVVILRSQLPLLAKIIERFLESA